MRRKTWIDDPEYLRRWFLEKEHPFLVFRTADLMDMIASDQRLFLKTVQLVAPGQLRAGPPPGRDEDLRRYLQRSVGLLGYVRVSVESLIDGLAFEELRRFQGFCSVYKDTRENKYEPIRVEDCECGGADRCLRCEGTGRITVLLEVSAVEQQLASGADYSEVDGL